ncbi:MAG: hypothetical protein ACOCXP_04335 [Candidatus Dojkabacteria bacterium]
MKSFAHNFRKWLRLTRRYSPLLLVLVVLMTAAGFALPDLELWAEQNQLSDELAFSNTLDFYGGSELVYTLASGSAGAEQRVAEQITRRLQVAGVNDFDLYLRENAIEGGQELVVLLPLDAEVVETQNFASYLALSDNVNIVKSTQEQPEEGGAAEPTQTPAGGVNYLSTSLETSDIVAVGNNFGAETNGHGLALRFSDESWANTLFEGWSDVSQTGDPSNPDRLFLRIDGQLVAGQTIPANSQELSQEVLMTTGLGDDRLTGRLLANIVSGSPLSASLQLTEVNNYPGSYDSQIANLRLSLLAGFLLIALGTVVINRTNGLVSVLNFSFVVVVSAALLKLLALPLGLGLLLGFLLALVLWILHTNWLLPILRIESNLIRPTESKKDQIISRRKNFRNFLLLSTSLLMILTLTRVPVVENFAYGFVVTSFVGYLAYTFVIRSSLLITDFALEKEK